VGKCIFGEKVNEIFIRLTGIIISEKKYLLLIDLVNEKVVLVRNIV